MSASLLQAWRATVQREPSAVALVEAWGDRSWTRAELSAAASAGAAGRPSAAGLARRRVGLSAPNGVGWWSAFLALLELDAIPVFIDAGEPRSRQCAIAAAAGAVALWSHGEWMPLPARGRRAAPGFCLVKLTSGSTGKPRAWPFTQAQMLADGRQVCRTMGIRAHDLNLAAIPLGHSYGLGNLVLPLILQGTPLLLVDSPLPNVLATAAAHWRPTVFPAVPPLLDALLRSAVAPTDLKSLRLVVSAGAAMPAALAREFREKFGTAVHNFYGASETGGICYDRTGEATATGRSVGKPLAGVRLRWRTGGRFQVVSAAVGGRGTFSPPDRARLNDQGELVLLGRSGRVVKVGARRVDLGEIEAALKSVAGVSDAYATASPAGPAVIVAAVATELPRAALRSALRDCLPAWKIPSRLVTLAALPHTARGKLDRPAVEALLCRSADSCTPNPRG